MTQQVTIYRVFCDDDSHFLMSANFSDPTSSIHVNCHDEDDETMWQPTPIQVAICRDPDFAATLVNEYLCGDTPDHEDVACVVRLEDAA